MALHQSASLSSVYSIANSQALRVGFSTTGRDCWTARKLKRRRRAALLQPEFPLPEVREQQHNTSLMFDQNNQSNNRYSYQNNHHPLQHRQQQQHHQQLVGNGFSQTGLIKLNGHRPSLVPGQAFNNNLPSELLQETNIHQNQYKAIHGNRENSPSQEQSLSKNGTLKNHCHTTPTSVMVEDHFNYSEKLNGTVTGSKLKAFHTSSGAGSLSKHFKHHKMPAPHRTEIVFKAINNALNNCVSVTQQDILALRVQCETVANHGTKELYAEAQRQSKAAERYLKRLEFHLTRVEEVQEQYESHLNSPSNNVIQINSVSNGSVSRLKNGFGETKRSPTNTHSLKNGTVLKELSQSLTKLEAELELLLGTLSIQLKGLVGFARLAPGDVFEVNLKCGSQKWKSKGRVGLDRNQVWDADLVMFRCLLEDMLDIKVAELRTFGKSLILIEKSFDPIELFSPHPQLMTVDLNRNGSLKLDLIATWNPLDGLLTSLSRSDSHWSLSHKPTSPVLLKPNYSNSPSINGTTTTTKFEFDGSTLKYTSPDTGSLLNQNGTLKRDSTLTNSSSSYKNNSYTDCNGNRANEITKIHPVENGGNSFEPLHCSGNGMDENYEQENDQSLIHYMQRVKRLLQLYVMVYPELQNLDHLINSLHSLIQVSNGPINRPTVSIENALGCFDFLRLETSSVDIDDIDNNIINGSSPFVRGHTNGYGNSSTDSTPRPRRYLKRGEHMCLMRTDNNGYGGNQNDNGPFETPTSSLPRRQSFGAAVSSHAQRLTTGSAELDLCLCHHFLHCELLLEKLKSYGPLHHRKQEAMYKLNVETAIVAQMVNLVRSGPPLAKVTEVFADIDASTDLQDVWLSACGSSQHGYYLSSTALKGELKRTYDNLVSVRYPDLVDKVFDKLLHLLSDRSSWNTTIITVYQFVFCFKNKHLPVFVESLAHETWIIENLRSRSVTRAYRVMERLKQVPVPPPPDCLRHIGAVLIDDIQQLRTTAESYLLHAQGALREDLVNTYLAFLEHEDFVTRRGACRALSVLQARRCISALAFVNDMDSHGQVREEAKRAVLSFGPEGKEALKNSHSLKADVDITRV